MESPTDAQRSVCTQFGVDPSPPAAMSKVGVARNLREGGWPVNGLRQPTTGDTCGWYLWVGENLPHDEDFFVPLHIEHVDEWRPVVVPFLALPPGWRFLLAPGHEDVWFDAQLTQTSGEL